jgi:methionyl-tRNA synthetase
MDINNLTNLQLTLIGAVVLWDVIWKGFALWKAARDDKTGWFIALLVLNTVGILPIIYLLFFKSDRE